MRERSDPGFSVNLQLRIIEEIRKLEQTAVELLPLGHFAEMLFDESYKILTREGVMKKQELLVAP